MYFVISSSRKKEMHKKHALELNMLVVGYFAVNLEYNLPLGLANCHGAVGIKRIVLICIIGYRNGKNI